MQQRMSSREFTEWQAYFRIQPFGPEREDLGHAVVAATVANANRDPKTKSDPFTVDDFLLVFDEKTREDLQQAKLRRKLNQMFGG